MKLNLLFPTVIGHVNDKDFTDKIKPIARDILNRGDNKGHDFLNAGYESTYGRGSVHDELFTYPFITNKISDIANQFIDLNGYHRIKNKKLDMFLSRMTSNDAHGRHQHPNSKLSGICYLNIDSGSEPITFYNNDFKNWNGMTIKTSSIYNETYQQFHPQEGDILIWESWIQHEVLPNSKLTGTRETLVFNIA